MWIIFIHYTNDFLYLPLVAIYYPSTDKVQKASNDACNMESSETFFVIFLSFFLSFCLSFFVLISLYLLIVGDHIQWNTQSVGLLSIRDQFVAEASTCTTHNIFKRQTFMPPAAFETTISASEQPQTHALDLAVTGIGRWKLHRLN